MIHRWRSSLLRRPPKLGVGFAVSARELVNDMRLNGLAQKVLLRSFMAVSPGQSHFSYQGQSRDPHPQMQIINMLRLGDKEKASNRLLNFGNHASNLRAEDFISILDYCARIPDPQAFKQIAFLGEHDFCQTYLPVYNTLLSGCVKYLSLADVNNCLRLMDRRLIGKSEATYWELLKFAVWLGNISIAREIWRDFLKYYSPSILSLRKFIWSFSRLGDLQSAYVALQRMVSMAIEGNNSLRKSGGGKFLVSRLDVPMPLMVDPLDDMLNGNENMFSPPEFSGYIVSREVNHEANLNNITGDLVAGDVEGLDKTCMVSTRKDGKEVTFGIEECHLPLQPCLSSSDEVGNERISQGNVLDAFHAETKPGNFLRADSSTPSAITRKILRWSFSDLIHAYAQCRKYSMVEHLFLQMRDLGLEPSSHTFDGFVRAIISQKGLTYAMQVVRGMEKRSLKPSNDTFSVLSVGYSEILDLDMAESLLDQISDNSPKYIHPYNALFAGCDATDQPERAVLILAKVKKLDMKPNIRTFELLFSLFVNVNAPYEEGNILSHAQVNQRLQTLETDMIRYGIKHSFVSLENLIRALGSEGMLREMLKYLHLSESLLLHPRSYQRTTIYNHALHSLVEAKETHMAIQLFKHMKNSDFPPDGTTYNIMIDCCSLSRCFKSACSLVSIMVRSGYLPGRVTYAALLKILLADDNFDAALGLLEQSINEGIETDVLLYNTVLSEAEKKGHIDIIEYAVEQMHQQKIQPDPATCNYVFSAYANHGLHNTAMEALQVLSMRMISGDQNVLLDKRILFEDLVLSEDPNVDIWIIDIFKEIDEHLAAALLNLRWSAILGYRISWSPEESPWSKRLSSCYGSIRCATLHIKP